MQNLVMIHFFFTKVLLLKFFGDTCICCLTGYFLRSAEGVSKKLKTLGIRSRKFGKNKRRIQRKIVIHERSMGAGQKSRF